MEASYRQAAPIFFAAFALNNVLPLRVGDVYRCVIGARFRDATIAKSLASLLTERVLDLVALTVLLSILLLFFRQAGLELISLADRSRSHPWSLGSCVTDRLSCRGESSW